MFVEKVAAVPKEEADGTRRRRTLYAPTRKEAARRLTEALHNRNQGRIFDEKTTLAQWLTRWLEDSVTGNVAEGTRRQYELHVNHHLIPALGSTKLAKFSPAAIQSHYAERLRTGSAPRSIHLTHIVLHRSLDQAVKFGLIPSNPAKRVDRPKSNKVELTPLSPEQARIFLDAARGERFETLFTVALTTGMRSGELLGLRWSDIDFAAGTLRVSRQIQRYPKKGLVLVEPKHGSGRTITLPQRALTSLRHHRKRQAEAKLRAPYYVDTGFVFVSEIGTPLDAHNIVHRHFKPLLRRAGLPPIRLHDLRHSCATLLLSRGVHPVYVQKLLGHASISLTLDRYSHFLPSMAEVTAREMDAALG